MTKKRKIIIISISILLVAAITIGSIFILKKEEAYALKVNDTIISPQLYQAYLMQKTLLAIGKVADVPSGLMEQEMEGIPVSDWIKREVEYQIVYDYVIKSEWDKLEEDVSQSEQERLDAYLDGLWEKNKNFYESNQCDRETFNVAYESFLYNDLVFDDYSSKNPLADDERTPTAQIASVKYFIINKYSLDGKTYTEEETDKLITLAEDYIKELKNGKSIDEVYQNYLVLTGEDSSSFRPISTSIISSDNTEYTSKLPNFINRLMEAKVEEPFYSEDDYYITIGIRQEEDDRMAVQQVYADNEVKKVQKERFDEYVESIRKNVKVKRNQSVIKKYSPNSIKLPESE